MRYIRNSYQTALSLPLLAVMAGIGCSSITTSQVDGSTAGKAASTVKSAEKVLFTSNRDGDLDLYVLDPSTGEISQLTNNNHDDFEASWSPDGKQVIFTSRANGNPDIYVINADGSGLNRLTDNPGLDGAPQWSPDGKKIAFISDRERRTDVYVMNSDGSNIINISQTETAATQPVWSPDGSTLAYLHSNSPKSKNIMLAAADGSKRWRLTDNAKSNDFDVAWSPDGSKIAYAAERNRPINLYVIDVDGKNDVKLTNTQWIDASPAWSPDGKKIAFFSNRDDGTRHQLYIIDADGSNEQRLSMSGAEESDVNWSASGKSVFYVSFRDGNAELYQRLPDGSGETRLTNNSAYDAKPQPMPHRSSSVAIHSSDSINSNDRLVYAANEHGQDQGVALGRITK